MKAPKDPKSAQTAGRRESKADARAASGGEARSGADSGDRPRAPLAELGIGAAWLVGLAAVNQIVGLTFATNPMAALVVQAVVVDLAVGKAGVKWDPREGDKAANETRDALRGIGAGAGIALAITGAAVGASAALGWANVTAHAPNTTLALGVVRAAAVGVRDTLLYAGLPLYFVGRAGGPKGAAVLFGALAAGAALCLHPAASPANVALAAAVLLAGAALWARDGMGWKAAGMVGGWALFAGAMFRGGLFDVDWKKGALAPGFAADGAPAWVAVGLFVAVAAAVLLAGKGTAARPQLGAGEGARSAGPVAGEEAAADEAGEATHPAKQGENEEAVAGEAAHQAKPVADDEAEPGEEARPAKPAAKETE